MKCDNCKKEIEVGGGYWQAIRNDGKRVIICEECGDTMEQIDPKDAPPIPEKTWSDKDN